MSHPVDPFRAVQPALLRRFPRLQGRLPWLALGQWPTPVCRLERLGARSGSGDLWLKQDGVSARTYGGNKVRKLEVLLAAALQRPGCRGVLTTGGVGSNHVVATAVHGRALGLATRAVVFPQVRTDDARANLRLALALGVDLVPCPLRVLVPAYLEREQMRTAASKAGRYFVIGPGGSSPAGALGYVAAALELAEQIEEGQLPVPDEIFIALGSGGSMAGLLVGLALAGLPSRVTGVRVVERIICNATLVRLLARRTARLLGHLSGEPAREIPPFVVAHGYLGQSYGAVTGASRKAMDLALQVEGLRLEPTYTGKALAALLDHLDGPGRGRRILFWSTINSQDVSPLLAGARPLDPPRAIARWLERRDG